MCGKLSPSPGHCRMSLDGGFVLSLILKYGGVLVNIEQQFLREAEDHTEEQA